MPVRVMLVDDSAIARGMIARGLAVPGIEMAAAAANGAEAIPLAKQVQPDIIILDIEMPEMDGLTALPKLLEAAPRSKIIMVSTLTLRNATISMQALEAGASDYVSKPTANTPNALDTFYRELQNKIYGLTIKPSVRTAHAAIAQPSRIATPIIALGIASSTGGPQALLRLFGGLKDHLRHMPIFITQHMPPAFTAILAEHLAQAGGRPCSEAKNGEAVRPGHTYIAPGDYHMLVAQEQGRMVLRLNQNPLENFCRPSADPMFRSLSRAYGKQLLAIVLTGMGHDGLEGARAVVHSGGSVIAQDQASSVVWGMPGAVAANNLCRAVLPIEAMADYLIRQAGG